VVDVFTVIMVVEKMKIAEKADEEEKKPASSAGAKR